MGKMKWNNRRLAAKETGKKYAKKLTQIRLTKKASKAADDDLRWGLHALPKNTAFSSSLLFQSRLSGCVLDGGDFLLWTEIKSGNGLQAQLSGILGQGWREKNLTDSSYEFRRLIAIYPWRNSAGWYQPILHIQRLGAPKKSKQK